MLASLTVKPLLIVVAVLSVMLTGSGYLNASLYKQLGAAKAECVAEQLETSNERSAVTSSLAESSLRNRVTELEAELNRVRRVDQEAAKRIASGSKAFAAFKDEVNEARQTDPTLDERVDTSRLRHLQETYRVRAKGSTEVRVSGDPE